VSGVIPHVQANDTARSDNTAHFCHGFVLVTNEVKDKPGDSDGEFVVIVWERLAIPLLTLKTTIIDQ
jgi:hypothetical protein